MILGKLWKSFNDLLPKTPRQVATISVVHGNGEYTVELLGGGIIRVHGNGDYQENERVFIAGDIIESKASDLPRVEIEI